MLIALLAFSLGCYLVKDHRLIFLEKDIFWFSCICITVIMATGYWINDVFDYKVDRVNKPGRVIISSHLSSKKVVTAYMSALFIVVVFSFFALGWLITLVNLAIISALFVYAWLLKRISVIGNILIASLTASVLAYPVLLLDEITWPLVWTIIFSFEVTFIREVIKDMEDIKGDLEFGLQTLPIQIGTATTKKIMYMCYGLFGLSHMLPVWLTYLLDQEFIIWYLTFSVLFVQIPTFFLLLKLFKAHEPEHYAFQSKWWKLLIFSGMLSVLLL